MPIGTSLGTPLATATGSPTMVPTIMTQASTTREPIIRLDRDEARVAVAHRTAAARPPRIAVTRSSLAGMCSGCRGHVRGAGAGPQAGMTLRVLVRGRTAGTGCWTVSNPASGMGATDS